MKKNETNKNKLATGLLIFAIIVIVVSLAYLVYFKITDKKQEKEIETQESENVYTEEIENEVENSTVIEQTAENTNNLKQGEYYIYGMQLNGDEESYGIQSVKIKENNEFSINFPVGTSYLGIYSIEGNIIKCVATKEENHEGGDGVKDIKSIEFTFEKVDEESIKYVEANREQPEFQLTEGKIYKIVNLELGTYVIKGMEISPDEENYVIESIEIKENNEFSINLPLGTSYTGEYGYEMANRISCYATKREETEGGGQKIEDDTSIFIFEIIDKENFKYMGADSEKPEFELTKGKTYTLTKEN